MTTLTSPRSINGRLDDVETETDILKRLSRQCLGENVSKLSRRGNMKHLNLTKSNLFTNKMNINLNMLCASVLNWIAGHVDC